jgi:DNA mismatch repair protein MutL
MKIRVLPDTVINQIAAGEVIERPASVARELIDNAADAGATDITVTVEGGGLRALTVLDNGSGMGRDDAVMAFERHATSKVQAASDLWTLTTLGFRGEALASIAAVSKVRLRTTSVGQNGGTEVRYAGGKLLGVELCAWGGGTEISVQNLFFNVPARRKFLKSERAEVARIKGWLQSFALARPELKISFRSDGEEVMILPAGKSLLERARQVFRGTLATVDGDYGEIRVQGAVLHPSEAGGDHNSLIILVNGRVVSDRLIQRAVREGFDSMLKEREYPCGVVSVTAPHGQVDINVHPQKSEVRFASGPLIFAAVRAAVLSAVRAFRGPITVASSTSVLAGPIFVPQGNATLVQAPPQRDWRPTPPPPMGESIRHGVILTARNSDPVPLPFMPAFQAPPVESEFRFAELRYIGQLLGCYLLCELGERFIVVDMHAAHERVNYNRIRKALEERAPQSQRLISAVSVELRPEQLATLEAHRDILSRAGLEYEPEPEGVRVTSAPAYLQLAEIPRVVGELSRAELIQSATTGLGEALDRIAARLACHASVRSGDLLGRDEAYKLFSDLDAAIVSSACPHGRPIVAAFSRETVEQWFGRDR